MIPQIRFKDFIDHIQTEVLQNPDFESFVFSLFGEPLTVFIGYVSANPPKQSDCPQCSIIPISTPLTQVSEEYVWSFAVDFCIEGQSIDKSENNVVRVEAIDRLDQLIKRFANDLNESLCDKNAYLSASNFSFHYNSHPLLIARGDVSFTIQNTLGQRSVTF